GGLSPPLNARPGASRAPPVVRSPPTGPASQHRTRREPKTGSGQSQFFELLGGERAAAGESKGAGLHRHCSGSLVVVKRGRSSASTVAAGADGAGRLAGRDPLLPADRSGADAHARLAGEDCGYRVGLWGPATMTELAKTLSILRIVRGWSQSELAEEARI